MKLVTKILVINHYYAMIGNAIKVCNLSLSDGSVDRGVTDEARELMKVAHSLSTLLITLQIHWERATTSKKPYIRPIRYQMLPKLADFPYLEVGQDVTKLAVHEKFICWTPSKFWVHFRMTREGFTTLYEDLEDTLTEKLGERMGDRAWSANIPKYLFLGGTLMYLGGYKYQSIEDTLGIESSTFYK